ncbi:MAG: DUF4837 family protein, partial [Flavobacteriales bacterium]|nr:DUF4837 family protein [Flavobacteriales bacterium]
MKYLSLIGMLALLLCACEVPEPTLTYSTGQAGEVTIVIEGRLWDGSFKKTVESKLRYELEGLPRPEFGFDLFVVDPSAFRKLYETNRSIIIFELADSIAQPKTAILKNKWAAYQVVTIIKAKTLTDAENEFLKRSDQIIAVMNDFEARRLQNFYKNKGDKMSPELINQTGLQMSLKPGALVAKSTKDFTWYRWEQNMQKGGFEHQVSQNILIYEQPYTDTTQLTLDYIINLRDSVLKKYVPGNSEGSYLSTSFRLLPPVVETVNIENAYSKLVRGLW